MPESEVERAVNEIVGRARAALAEAGLDALIVSSAVEDTFGRHALNRRYLSGFRGSTGLVLLTQERAILALDSRYLEAGGTQCPDFEIWATGQRREREWLRDLVAEAGLAGRRIGVSRDDMSVGEYVVLLEVMESFEPSSRPEIVPAPYLLEELRARKTADEVARLERAVAVADAAYEQVLAAIRPGLSEREVARLVEDAVRAKGGEGIAFETIVASGPRASMPHAAPSDRTLRAGDPLIIDMGAVVEGYCSDLSRTTVVGDTPDRRFEEIYAVVARAQQAAIEGARAGVTGAALDAVARRVIEEAGYGEAFGHGLGHGVGLAIHERPYLGRMSEDVLEEGMVFTIEPGVYIPGWGGVRIEDIVLLDGGRARVLSRARKRRTDGGSA